MTTAILNLMRDAALAYTIGFIDIMGAGNNLISRNLGNYSLETYTAVAVIYWGIALVISFSAQLLEKRLSVTEKMCIRDSTTCSKKSMSNQLSCVS